MRGTGPPCEVGSAIQEPLPDSFPACARLLHNTAAGVASALATHLVASVYDASRPDQLLASRMKTRMRRRGGALGGKPRRWPGRGRGGRTEGGEGWAR
eukprot:366199-Chlamydomonas_euryale.AAC.23